MAISMKHKSITIDVNDRNAPNVVGIVNVNDKATRYLDVTLTASGEKLTFADCIVTATFATDGYLISDSVACTLNSTADIITVPLENFKSMSGFLAIEIKIANGDTQVLNTPLTLKVMVTPSLAENSKINGQSVGNFVDISREIATARGSSNSLGARLDTVDANLTKKANKSDIDSINSHLQSTEATLKNKANTTDVSKGLANKADKATTLAGYGISDAYTKSEIKEKLARKLDSRPFDDEPKQGSPCYLTSGTVYNSLLTKANKTETDNLLGNKADKVDIDASLANKADLVNSSNIFDFDAWAKGLQSLTNPVYRGTLDKVDYTEKSFALTATEPRAYTNGWISSTYPQSMRIAVKPNTKYLFSWLPSSTHCGAYVFLNGVNSDTTRFELRKGFGSFTTAEDTAYIMIRFDYDGTGFFKVSEIMITEKESIYLPNKVAEGVPEVADEILAFEKTTQASLDGKYDSSNIESGTSMLTPYSTVTDKIKSASCTYKTIGDIVIVSATVKMNAATIGANSTYPLIDLPYKCIAEDNVFCVGISNLGKVFKFAVLKNNTWLQFQTQDKTAYTFADGEQINVICSYKIK